MLRILETTFTYYSQIAAAAKSHEVQRDYGKPSAKALEHFTVSEMKALLDQHQFGAGSMGPKVEAAIDFLSCSKKPSAQVLITSCERAAEALAGKTGTRVRRN